VEPVTNVIFFPTYFAIMLCTLELLTSDYAMYVETSKSVYAMYVGASQAEESRGNWGLHMSVVSQFGR